MKRSGVYAQLLKTLCLAAIATPTPKVPSIAVLPFANMSREADEEYFSDGLAEEIINALTQVSGLKVIVVQSVRPAHAHPRLTNPSPKLASSR
jgi:TolB-like protein